MNFTIFGRQKLIAAAFGLMVMCISVSDIDAQTKRKKKPTKRPVPVSTVVQPQTEPLIISRAEDFPDTGSTIVQPMAIERLAEPAGTADTSAQSYEDLLNRIKSLEALKKNDYDTKQKRLMLNLDILTRAESRAETLRKQLFDMIEKENTYKAKLDQIDTDIRPEAIERSVAFAGTLRPEELRGMRKKSLDSEKTNLQMLVTEIQRIRSSLDQNVQKADILVDKLRAKLEKEIDDALVEEPKDN
ncbi:MAG: hypothetical protein H7070_12190 [Saprospiraceae bacterium]|nr:hypothetical protein [Pyrinomonadaceae bacterium]